jgi:hypothetical protein
MTPFVARAGVMISASADINSSLLSDLDRILKLSDVDVGEVHASVCDRLAAELATHISDSLPEGRSRLKPGRVTVNTRLSSSVLIACLRSLSSLRRSVPGTHARSVGRARPGRR